MYVKIDSTQNGYRVIHDLPTSYKDYSIERRDGEGPIAVAERALKLATELFMRQFEPEEAKSDT